MKNRKVISLISAKGGAGKTILTATIGKALSEIGKNVLLIDADAATNGLTLFYYNEVIEHKEDKGNNCKGIFEQDFVLGNNEIIPLSENFNLLPATFSFKNTIELPEKDFEKRIEEIIAKIDNHIQPDIILIDNQAGSEYYTEFVIKRKISDKIIIVSEYDPISAAGVERLKGFFHEELTYDRTWIVLNKVLSEFKDVDTSFLEISKYLPPIIWNSQVVKSYSKREIPLDFKFGNTYTISIIKLLKSLFGKLIEEDLNVWLKDKEDMVKSPIIDEYVKVKEQLMKYKGISDKTWVSKSEIIFRYFPALVLPVAFGSLMLSLRDKFSLVSSKNYNIFIMLVVSAILFIYLFFLFYKLKNRKRASEELYMYEIEVLAKRIKELELMKQASIEDILNGDINKRIIK